MRDRARQFIGPLTGFELGPPLGDTRPLFVRLGPFLEFVDHTRYLGCHFSLGPFGIEPGEDRLRERSQQFNIPLIGRGRVAGDRFRNLDQAVAKFGDMLERRAVQAQPHLVGDVLELNDVFHHVFTNGAGFERGNDKIDQKPDLIGLPDQA